MAEWKNRTDDGRVRHLQAGPISATLYGSSPAVEGVCALALTLQMPGMLHLSAADLEAAQREAESILRGIAREILAAVGEDEPE
jgi:hypothetical protein